jgi:RHS repeat-associated protein
MKILRLSMLVCLWLSASVPLITAQQQPNSFASSIKGRFIFSRPIIWVGNQAPDDSHSSELAKVLDLFNTDPRGGIDAVEQFIASDPDSPWTPSLNENLAEYNRNRGRYTLALKHWEAAWNETKDGTDPNSREIAGRTIGLWCRLLGSLGRRDELQKLFAEAGQRGFDTSAYGSLIMGGQQATAMMKARPGLTFRCGSFALAQASRALAPTNEVWKKLQQIPSPDGGFRLSELAALASRYGLNFVPLHRDTGSELVVPSVIHWQLDHYAAIVSREKDGRYRVIDPTFGSGLIMDADTINAEASGNFLVPSDHQPEGWRALGADEASRIHGKGFPDIISDAEDTSCSTDDDPNSDDGSSLPQANDGDPVDSGSASQGCTDCPTNNGLASWRISQPYIALWLTDIPLAFKNSAGGWTRLIMSYKQTADTADDRYFGFGSRWSCNWLDSLVESTNSTSTIRQVGGGGEQKYALQQAEEQKGEMMDILSGSRMTTNRKGASRMYKAIQIILGEQRTNYFISDRVDSFGRATMHFDYDLTNTPVRLLKITDFDGKVITLNYTNTAHSNLITSITGPYSNTVYFAYSSSGTLTNITDPMGMSSRFSYDSTGFITNLHTPYGDTSFKYFTSTNPIGGGDPLGTGTNGSVLNRAIEITEPNSAKQLYAFRDDGNDTNGVPVSGNYNTFDFENYMNRNSYHWNREQYQQLSAAAKTNYLDMPASDYWKASLKHWLHRSYDSAKNVLTLSGILGAEAGPVVDSSTQLRAGSIHYAYYGQTDPAYAGTVGWITNITRGVNDLGGSGDQFTTTINRNDVGRPTVITYSYLGAQTASYTNEYDLDGRRLLRGRGPRGEIVAGYAYTGPTNYVISAVTNAATNVTSYTYDTNAMHLTSTAFASGLTNTNIFYTSGSFSNFLASTIDLGFRTNSFSYAGGNIAVQTNELGLIISNSWDNLNRLVQVSFPDGSTISNLFSNLDLVGVKDRMSYWTTFGYNNVRQMISATNANGAVTQIQYCDCGAPSQVTHWLGTRALNTLYFYDAAGRNTNVVYPDAYSVTNQFYIEGTLYKSTDSSGRQLTFTSGMYGILTNLALGTQLLLHRELDEYGRAFQTTDLNGVVTTNDFDALGRVLSRRVIGNEVVSISGLEQFTYNSSGLAAYTDPLGHATTFSRDAYGRITTQINANSETNQFSYNAAGLLASLTNGKGSVTRWNFDGFGRVTNKVDANNSEMFRYAYDLDSRLTNRLQAGTISTTFLFDSVGNLTNIIHPSSPSIVYQYDDLKRLTNMTDGIGTTAFTWTDGNQLASEDGPWANDTVSYTYSGRQRVSMSLQQPNANAWVQSYTYDDFGRLGTTTCPAGSFMYYYGNGTGSQPLDQPYQLDLPNGTHIAKTFDDLGRLVTTALKNSSWAVLNSHSYEYNQGHQRTRQTFTAANYVDYTYDNIGQLKTATGTESDGTTRRLNEQFGYGYDAGWNLSYRTNNDLTENFSVNNLNELTSISRSGTMTVAGSVSEPPGASPYAATNVTVNDSANTTAFLYSDGTFAATNQPLNDGINIISATAHDSAGRSASATSIATLPASTSLVYDNRGNLRTNKITALTFRIYDYDDDNQLVGVTAPGEWKSLYSYDGQFRLRIRTEFTWQNGVWLQTNESHYIYDTTVLAQERDANSTPLITYTRGQDLSRSAHIAAGVGGLLARTENQLMITQSSFASSFYHADAGGNVTALFGQGQQLLARYSFDPFGNPLLQAGSLANMNQYLFSTKEFDRKTGLYYYGYRMYSPSLQKWMSRDPLQESGSLNQYTPFENDPLSHLDPLGASDFNRPPANFNATGPADYPFPALDPGTGPKCGCYPSWAPSSGGILLNAGMESMGAAGTASSSVGLFASATLGASIASFTSAGGFAGMPVAGEGQIMAPQSPGCLKPFVMGAATGLTSGFWISNAGSVVDLGGPFDQWNLNTQWFSLSFALSGDTWLLSLSFGVKSAYGYSFSEYPTTTFNAGGFDWRNRPVNYVPNE